MQTPQTLLVEPPSGYGPSTCSWCATPSTASCKHMARAMYARRLGLIGTEVINHVALLEEPNHVQPSLFPE